jgi:hypothetical protein
MKPNRYGAAAAVALIAFLIVSNVAYVGLINLFGYDDVLREPVDVVLARFQAGGPALILAWAGFAWSALIFIVAAVLVAKALKVEHGQTVWMATVAGAASGLVQATGLLRWVFVVPSLAAAYAAPASTPADRAAIAQIYNALNQYGGVALGEHLGQLLLVAWSAGVLAACWRAGGLLRWTSIPGLACLPLWLIGQTELFATVMPATPVIEVTPLAFMVWMVWLLALAIALVAPRRKGATSR